jgi:hypothetical protein
MLLQALQLEDKGGGDAARRHSAAQSMNVSTSTAQQAADGASSYSSQPSPAAGAGTPMSMSSMPNRTPLRIPQPHAAGEEAGGRGGGGFDTPGGGRGWERRGLRAWLPAMFTPPSARSANAAKRAARPEARLDMDDNAMSFGWGTNGGDTLASPGRNPQNSAFLSSCHDR